MHCTCCRSMPAYRRREQVRGERLAEMRRARGITQEELAEQINVGPRHLRRLEAGQSRQLDNLRLLDRVARALNMALGELIANLGGEDEPDSYGRHAAAASMGDSEE
jgi:transcriptional regulator with XRE-family HTH domain